MVNTSRTRIDERIPAKIHRANGEALCEIAVERFMGVVMHPVPSLEMQDLFGRFAPGGKVLVEWSREPEGWHEVLPGDHLVIGDRELTIRGVYECPPCYMAIYVDAPPLSGT